MQHTLALVKPDAVRAGKAAEMQQLIEMAGFDIIAKRQLQLTRHMAEDFYGEHKGKPFYPGLVEFMTSGPIVALVLAKDNAIKAWRELMGPTDVFEARVKAPKSMRALYGTNGTRNAAHGSDSLASAQREIKFYFPQLQLSITEDPAAAQEYIMMKLQPTLVKALTALATQKPTSKPEEAITFLANWLLEHNPSKPRIAVPEELLQQQKQQVQAAQAAAAAAQAVRQPWQKHNSSAGRLQPPAGDDCSNDGGSDLDSAHNAAATKVQACFRGHQARKHVADMRAAESAAHV